MDNIRIFFSRFSTNPRNRIAPEPKINLIGKVPKLGIPIYIKQYKDLTFVPKLKPNMTKEDIYYYQMYLEILIGEYDKGYLREYYDNDYDYETVKQYLNNLSIPLSRERYKLTQKEIDKIQYPYGRYPKDVDWTDNKLEYLFIVPDFDRSKKNLPKTLP
jgi:hypothetical protein